MYLYSFTYLIAKWTVEFDFSILLLTTNFAKQRAAAFHYIFLNRIIIMIHSHCNNYHRVGFNNNFVFGYRIL